MPKQKKRFEWSFDKTILVVSWATLALLWFVSLPHAQEIIYKSEQGSESFRDWKAWSFAIAIEVVPALFVIVALHLKDLSVPRRYGLWAMAMPFVVLSLHIQLAYNQRELQLWSIELAFPLPYGIIVCTTLIAFVLNASKVHINWTNLKAELESWRIWGQQVKPHLDDFDQERKSWLFEKTQLLSLLDEPKEAQPALAIDAPLRKQLSMSAGWQDQAYQKYLKGKSSGMGREKLMEAIGQIIEEYKEQ